MKLLVAVKRVIDFNPEPLKIASPQGNSGEAARQIFAEVRRTA